MNYHPEDTFQKQPDYFNLLQLRTFALLSISLGVLAIVFVYLPYVSFTLPGDSGRDLLLDVWVTSIGLSVIACLSYYAFRAGRLSLPLRIIFVAVVVMATLVALQYNGTPLIATLAAPLVITLLVMFPNRYGFGTAAAYVISIFIIQHYTTQGAHNHEVDARIFQALLITIWPISTLAMSRAPVAELKANLVKQLFLASAVVGVVTWLLDPIWHTGVLLNAGISFVVWLWLRNQLTLSIKQRFIVLLILVAGFSAAVLRVKIGPLFIISASIMLIFACLPRFWATLLSVALILLAASPHDYMDDLMWRGLASALLFTYLLNLWFSLLDETRLLEFDRFNLFAAVGLGVCYLLIDLLPLIFGAVETSSREDRYLTIGLEALQAIFVIWIVYELLSFLGRNRDQKTQLRERLNDHRATLETALEATDLGVFKMELTTQAVEVNRRFREIFDLPRSGPLSMELLTSRTHPDDKARVDAWITERMTELTDGESQHRIVVQGTVRHIYSRAVIRESIESGPIVYSTVQDITDSVLKVEVLESMNRRLGLALDVAGLALYELDVASEELTLISGNRLLVTQSDKLDMNQFADQFIPSMNDRNDFLECCRSDNRTAEYQVVDPVSGKAFWARIRTGGSYWQGKQQKRLLIRLDITQERGSIVSLQEAQEKQRELFAIIGHELRTPVAAIDMAMADSDLSAAEKIRISAELSSSLLSILDDLRTVVNPERAMQAPDLDANPSEVCERAVTALLPLSADKGVSLEFSADRVANRDFLIAHQALRQVVTNLTKNALLHAKAKNVWVRLTGREVGLAEAKLLLVVEDDGVGIPESEQELIFKKFSRGTTSADGSGLGLYIVTELAKLLEGELSYEVRSAGGSRFILEFGANTNVEGEKTTTPGPEYSLEGKRVLVAEDDKFIRILTEKVLVNAKSEVTLAEDGQEAIAIIENSTFDLVLTDIMMPNIDGYELCEKLRERGFEGPIIGITAAVIGEETDRLLRAGADAVLSKPIKVDRLRETLGELTSQSTAKEKGA